MKYYRISNQMTKFWIGDYFPSNSCLPVEMNFCLLQCIFAIWHLFRKSNYFLKTKSIKSWWPFGVDFNLSSSDRKPLLIDVIIFCFYFQYHPDSNQNRSNSHEQFISIKKAYDVLSDVRTRWQYDQQLRGGFHQMNRMAKDVHNVQYDRYRLVQYYYSK